jgi:hypothetical protein
MQGALPPTRRSELPLRTQPQRRYACGPMGGRFESHLGPPSAT